MILNKEAVEAIYYTLIRQVNNARQLLKRPLTLTEKILYGHMAGQIPMNLVRGESYISLLPDRVAMQDATAQMAMLQFMNTGADYTSVDATIHCDHLIVARENASADMKNALRSESEVYDFLTAVSARYGIGFWKPGAGIIHQILFENYAVPGSLMIGADSHTVNAGGLGMIAIGAGGADIVDVMAGLSWELRLPKIIGVKLTGRLSGWTSPKDLILALAGLLTVKGGTNSVIEYFGSGTETLSCTGKGTICNMGAEVGATTSVFPYDNSMERYLMATGRDEIASMAGGITDYLQADKEVIEDPEKYYDRVIEIDLSSLVPYVNGPFTPDAATPLPEFAKRVREMNYPAILSAGLIGSCTNSSYEDLTRAASVASGALGKGIRTRSQLIVTPGSDTIRITCERNGILQVFRDAGATIMANACGPCIGQWKRDDFRSGSNSVVTSYNRNFAGRNDDNLQTHAFLASPEIVMAMTLAGRIDFNPLTDSLPDAGGRPVMLDPPSGDELPPEGLATETEGYIAPQAKGRNTVIRINPASDRLHLLEPFAAWDGNDLTDLLLLIRVKGKCTTDHISKAGPWLRYRGHLDKISGNLLMGAVNAFNGESDRVRNQLTGETGSVSQTARYYRSKGRQSVVVSEENYGEGSSREHAAMEPRHLGVRVIIAKSFARIHETNLKKQGILALTFIDKDDYEKIMEDDLISVYGIGEMASSGTLQVGLKHSDGSSAMITVAHTYSSNQLEWFKAGGALNMLRDNRLKKAKNDTAQD
jgi:aconitate hydratase